jgi:hypothetical protein
MRKSSGVNYSNLASAKNRRRTALTLLQARLAVSDKYTDKQITRMEREVVILKSRI